MSLGDIPDVFIGSTDDGHTFVVLNRRIRNADRLLTEAGFLAREHRGRKFYLLPPGTAQDAHERAGVAMYGLLAHTHDLIDLSWTTRWNPGHPAGDPDLHFQFRDGSVAVTGKTTAARSLLEQHGFTLTADGSSYRPRGGLHERGLLGAVTAAETHAYVHGLSARVGLDIPTPTDIPPVGRRPAAATGPLPAPPSRRRTR
ncbi:hypothetical protein AB0D59_32315 [Streptomyces sp. NPDC048417]|uniref:hypothetical protein n=1 Tax=Streptomyces sp. NPDC048417 TaxID=3155387 RepID=UPI00342CB121